MPDRDNVIKELVEHIESALSVDSDYVDCVRTDLLQYAVVLLKEQDKFVNVDKLREELGFAESCEKCKKDSWHCQRDAYFTEMDFCNRLDLAIEELTQEGR